MRFCCVTSLWFKYYPMPSFTRLSMLRNCRRREGAISGVSSGNADYKETLSD